MFKKLKKIIRTKWFHARIAVRKKLHQADNPLALLLYTADAILDNPDFDLIVTSRNGTIFAPMRAKELTEILSVLNHSLLSGHAVTQVKDLGPFREMNYFAFLNTNNGCIDNGRDHALFHVSVIREIAIYLTKDPEDTQPNSRYNKRMLSPLVTDLQTYLDKIIFLYEH